jgi:heme/copper-type cytochrome/quinol oxidase subunit 3
MPDTAIDQRAARTTSAPVLGMVLFVASEAMFFAAFFAIYAMSYSSHAVWPPAGIPDPSLALPTVATGLMLASSAFVHAGVRGVREGRVRRLNRWLGLTVASGAVAAALQISGYAQAGFGIRAGIYASLFYVMTMVALAHIVGGLVLLGMVLTRAAAGGLSMARHEPAEAAAIYWHFVVAVSVALYAAFYVIPTLHLKGP